MKKTLPIVTIFVLTIVLSACIPAQQPSNQQINYTDNTTQSETNPQGSQQNPSTSPQYVAYTPTIIQESANQGKKVVLFFHASWCPTCKAANEDLLNKIDQIPDDIIIVKTDYDTYTNLKEKYGITYQHTFVQVDGEGNQITVWNGGDLDEIISNVK